MKETLKEAVSRKHFQMVADTLKAVQDPKKRAELANHHASIFAQANPRFDHKRFMAAANVTEEVEIDESYDSLVSIWKKGPKQKVYVWGKRMGGGYDHDMEHRETIPDGLAIKHTQKRWSHDQVIAHLKGQGFVKAQMEDVVKDAEPIVEGELLELNTYTVHHDDKVVHQTRYLNSAIETAMQIHGTTGRKPTIMRKGKYTGQGVRVEYDAKMKGKGIAKEEVELDEVAKWRTNPKAHTQTKPEDTDSSEDYDYYNDNPKSTGYKTPNVTGRPDSLPKFSVATRPLSKHDIASKGPRKGLPTTSFFSTKKNAIKNRLGTHTAPNLPESLAYELDESAKSQKVGILKYALKTAQDRHAKLKDWNTAGQHDAEIRKVSKRVKLFRSELKSLGETLAYEGEGTYTVHHGKTGEKVHTGLNKKAAMDAAVALHAKTGVKPTVYHRAVSGYGGHSYGKIKQEIPIEGTVMADKPNLTESERIAYKAAFKDALDEAARKVSVGDTVLVGTRKGYVSAKGGDHVDVLHDDEKAPKSYHHSKVAKYSKKEVAEGETYMVGSKTFKDKATADKHSAMLRSGGPYMVGSKTFKDKAAADKHSASLRKESYEPKAAVPGTFNAPRSEFDSTPGYNVLGSEQIHGKTVKYVRMGSFFAPVVVAVDGEPWENAEGQPIKFAGQQAARDEMWAKLNPAMQAAFDAAQSGKGGANENEVEDEKVFAPKAPGMEESTNPDEWDDSLVEEIIIEASFGSAMFAKGQSEYIKKAKAKLSPEEGSHIDQHLQPRSVNRRDGSYMKLPYKTPEHRAMVDSISKKLGLTKKFRGPRGKRWNGSSAFDTKKAVAHSVALYYK